MNANIPQSFDASHPAQPAQRAQAIKPAKQPRRRVQFGPPPSHDETVVETVSVGITPAKNSIAQFPAIATNPPQLPEAA
jgi:hypothetical protein